MSERGVPLQEQIDDPQLRKAVDLLDQGKADELRALLAEHPDIITRKASLNAGYFAHPVLLEFVAENPIRHDRMPDNVVDVARVVLDAGGRNDREAVDGTLELVASGCVSREHGHQVALIDLLCQYGGDADRAMPAALGHGEFDAVEALINNGAAVTLPVAAATDRLDDFKRLLREASDDDRHRALALATQHGRAEPLRILLERGEDPNRFNPKSCHAHSTPLHQAVFYGHAPCVQLLIDHGADLSIEDTVFHGTPAGWARHCEREAFAELLDEAAVFMPAVRAVKAGNVEELERMLDLHPYLAKTHLGTNPRTLLHHATDWPGHYPRVGETIRVLVKHGANPNARFVGPHEETPLHWAASSDDVDAIDALLDCDANINALGGVITGGPPLADAVIFVQKNAIERLLDRGARYDVRWAAGAGRLDLVESAFDDEGKYRDNAPHVPGHVPDDSVAAINTAFWLAAQAGHDKVLAFLADKTPDINQVIDHRTALDVARFKQHGKCVALIESLGGTTAAKSD